jgi:hypothetical protein
MINHICPLCFKHRVGITCEAARKQELLEASRLNQFRVHEYNQAVLRVNIHCGPGAADAIIDLMKCWQALGEHNAR